MSGNYCYSWNGEDYSNGLFDTEEEAIEDARSSDPDAEEVWIGTATEPTLTWNSNEEEIIESIHENLADECGDYAESFEISTEDELDLATMIDETVKKWIDKHKIKPSCYTVIDGGLYVLKE